MKNRFNVTKSLLVTCILAFVFVGNINANEINAKEWVNAVFKKPSKLSFDDKKLIAEELTDFGKKEKDGDGYVFENGKIYYMSPGLNRKDRMDSKVIEKDINNDGIMEIFIKKSCPPYLCGTTGVMLYAFYKVNNQYKKVYSSTAAGYAIIKSNAIYPDLAFMGRGFKCGYFSWDKKKLKYKFEKRLKEECSTFKWNQ